jgi:PAS domain S-box-containing protein
MFGYERSELVGLHLSQLMPARYRAEHERAMQRSAAGGPPKIIGVGQRELVGERKDGSRFALELGVNDLRQGDERLLVGICRDITPRKVVEAQVKSNVTRIEVLCYEQNAGQDLALEVMQRQADRPSLKDPCLHALSLPAPRFSGEIAAAVRGRGERLVAMVADATSYGLSAAVSLMPLLTIFHEHAGRSTDLEELLAHLRRVAQSSLPHSRSVMMTLVSIDPLQGRGEVFVAGMPPALVLTVDGQLREQLDPLHAPLGLEGPMTPPYRLELAPGDQLVLSSDGLLDLLVKGSVDEALAALRGRFEGVAPEGRLEVLRGELERTANARHDRDDATLLLVDFAPGRVPSG